MSEGLKAKIDKVENNSICPQCSDYSKIKAELDYKQDEIWANCRICGHQWLAAFID